MGYQVEKDFVTKAGFRAVICFVHNSHYCGYVGIPKEHILHSKSYSEERPVRLPANEPIGDRGIMPIFLHAMSDVKDHFTRLDCYFNVHGGLTYSGSGDEGYPTKEPNDLWWFGFDCAHDGDATKGKYAHYYPGDVFRDKEYVEAQLESLAQQLKDYKENKVVSIAHDEVEGRKRMDEEDMKQSARDEMNSSVCDAKEAL